MAAVPECAKKHTTPQANDALVLGNGNTLGNVLVYVKSGLPAGKTYPAPTSAVGAADGSAWRSHVAARADREPR